MNEKEPDEKDKQQKESKINNDFLTFQVDLKKEKFQHNFNRINSIFKGDFTKFVRSKTDENLKEIYVLLRKYQYFISSCVINSVDILNHNNDETLLNKTENNFQIIVDILPKFKRNEINYEIQNDLLNIVINLRLVNNSSNEGLNLQLNKFEIEVINFKKDKFFFDLVESLTNVYFEHLENFENVFKALNKYLTYIENYFPNVFKEILASRKITQYKKKENEDSALNWNQDEQDKFFLT